MIRDLHTVTRSVTSGRKLRSVLVVVEVALAVILTIGAGLMVRSFTRLLNVDSGILAVGGTLPSPILTIQQSVIIHRLIDAAEQAGSILGRVQAKQEVRPAEKLYKRAQSDNRNVVLQAGEGTSQLNQMPAQSVRKIVSGYGSCFG